MMEFEQKNVHHSSKETLQHMTPLLNIDYINLSIHFPGALIFIREYHSEGISVNMVNTLANATR